MTAGAEVRGRKVSRSKAMDLIDVNEPPMNGRGGGPGVRTRRPESGADMAKSVGDKARAPAGGRATSSLQEKEEKDVKARTRRRLTVLEIAASAAAGVASRRERAEGVRDRGRGLASSTTDRRRPANRACEADASWRLPEGASVRHFVGATRQTRSRNAPAPAAPRGVRRRRSSLSL